MKTRFISFFLAGLLTVSLAACGSGGGNSGNDAAAPAASESQSYDGSYEFENKLTDTPMEVAGSGIPRSTTNSDPSESGSIYDSSKLILRASITAEATDFDAAVSAIEQQVSKAGGYIENSSVSGSVGYRWGSFTIRVPREQFESTFDAVGENCHITESSRSTENVSASYYDSEARKTALETKRDRLLALLEKAESMEDIITLESALSDVQYEIESLSGTLRGYDRLISFSTIELYLDEVRDLSLVQQEDSFLSDLKTAAVSGTRGLVSFVQNLILALVYGGWFVLIAVVVIVLVLLRLRRRRREQAAADERLTQPLSPSEMLVKPVPEDKKDSAEK